MTPRERWLTAISHQKPDRVPMDFWGTDEVIADLMRHLSVDTPEAVYDALRIDKPFVIADRYTGPPLPANTDSYGIVTTRVTHATGSYDEAVVHPLADFESVEEIDAHYSWPTPDWWSVDHMAEELEATGDRPVSITMAGVYTDYTKLRGLEQAFVDFALNHDIVAYCLQEMYAIAEERSARLIEAARGRIDIAWIFHDLGSQEALMCAPDTVRSLFLPGVRRLSSLARGHGIRVCLHSDGAIREAVPDLIEAGIEVLNPVQWRCKGMDRRGLVADFGGALTFHGAVDNQVTLASNDDAAVRREVRENIDIFAQSGGYILAPCHNLQPVTSPETIVAMYDEGFRYGQL